MLVVSLGSGSAGNCTLFESEQTSVLVDAGFSARETDKRLKAIGRSLEKVSALLITHEHYDHVRGAERIGQKYGIAVYMTRGTRDASGIATVETPIVLYENNSSFRIGDLQIHARKTMHDAADPSCFVVEGGDGTRVGIASDLGIVDPGVLRHLSSCDGLFFESNHDVDMLREGSYPWSLKRRILSNVGHLSNDDAMHALQRMIGPELQNLCLIHLSSKNNHESIVKTMANEMLERTGARLQLEIAKQDRPGIVMALARRGPRPQAPSMAQLRLF